MSIKHSVSNCFLGAMDSEIIISRIPALIDVFNGLENFCQRFGLEVSDIDDMKAGYCDPPYELVEFCYSFFRDN
jgi:hypothetical protein